MTADLDGDGNADVIVAYDNVSADHAHPSMSSANAIYIWYGKSDGTYEAPVVMTPSRNFYQIAAMDLNGDGLPELAMSDGYVVSVQTNLGKRAFGQEMHFLAGMGINSISAGDVNKDGLIDLVIANGGTVLAEAIAGKAAVTSDVITGGITVLLGQKVVTKVATTTVLTISSPLTVSFGQMVNGTAQVKATDGSALTGTISFFDSGDDDLHDCCFGHGLSGQCRRGICSGNPCFDRGLFGDDAHLGSTSAAVTIVVTPVAKAQTVTMLTSSLDPSTVGQNVTFTANVVAADSNVVPTGAVTFLDGSMVLGTKTLVGSGVASFSTRG